MMETCKPTQTRGLACSASLMIAASILGLTHHENPHSAVWIRREKQTPSPLSLQRPSVAESDGSQVAARWHAPSSPGTRRSTTRRRINNELRMTLIHRRHRAYRPLRRDRWPNVRNGAVEPSSRNEQRITDISAWIQRRHSLRTCNIVLTPWVKNLPDRTTKTDFSADIPRVIYPLPQSSLPAPAHPQEAGTTRARSRSFPQHLSVEKSQQRQRQRQKTRSTPIKSCSSLPALHRPRYWEMAPANPHLNHPPEPIRSDQKTEGGISDHQPP